MAKALLDASVLERRNVSSNVSSANELLDTIDWDSLLPQDDVLKEGASERLGVPASSNLPRFCGKLLALSLLAI